MQATPLQQGLPRLHTAARNGCLRELNALLDAGEDPEQPDHAGRTPMVHAAVGSSVPSAMLLLRRGARPDPLPGSPDRPFVSALMVAVSSGYEEIARVLIEAGADVNLEMKGPNFGAGADVEAVNPNGRTPLHLAAAEGNCSAARLLLEAGARPAPPCRYDGSTPLHCAAERGHYEIAELLVKAGAPAGSVKPNGTTPLHMAAQGNNSCVLRLLVRAGAPLNPENRHGSTPLMTAAAHGNARALSALVSAGADTSKRNVMGWRALESVYLARTPGDRPFTAAAVDCDNEWEQEAMSEEELEQRHLQNIAFLLYRAPGSGARARSWRWPRRSGGGMGVSALNKRQQQQQQQQEKHEKQEKQQKQKGTRAPAWTENSRGAAAAAAKAGVRGLACRAEWKRHGSGGQRSRTVTATMLRRG
ncbi:ankyrin repeat protein [Ectocarpus siliculosus]|uniref:Ankyrin repeat protein n=1 Tax=Ectocarpus siliculosus TaxID=2880 RepID=D8LQX4_ECTSI|nr:ankyrin repeat protein [Ectocarpus siliculosus]|eukprot:CBN77647.1 ankyrin repeat protein [Ectocarpus siliculosus]